MIFIVSIVFDILYIVEKIAKDKNYHKIRDRCHYNGKYRGAAHSIYNQKLNLSNEIPVIFLMVQIMIIISLVKN